MEQVLKDVIYLSNEDYELLVQNGEVTINGTTLTYDENTIYITPDVLASQSENGLMSAEDKVKLDSLQPGTYATIDILNAAIATKADKEHTHDSYITKSPTTITEGKSTDTNELTLSHGAKYSINAAGDSFVFTMPASPTVPTKTSDLTNDSGFITGVSWGQVTDKPTFATVAGTGDYNDLINKPQNLITGPQVEALLENKADKDHNHDAIYAPTSHGHNLATSANNGFMSATDKANLDTIVESFTSDDADTTIDTIKEVLKAFENAPEGTDIVNALAGKVDKVTGKGLSTNDFTDTLKEKLDGIQAGANLYTHPTYTTKSSDLYKITVDNTGHVSAATAVAKSDITGLGIPAQDTTYTFATGDSNGQIKVTPSRGTAQNISVKGLGSAAYTDSTAYASSTHSHTEYQPLLSQSTDLTLGTLTANSITLSQAASIKLRTDATLTIPSKSGTIALTSDIPTSNNQLTNDAGYTSNTGTVTSVTIKAGTGLTSSSTNAITSSGERTISIASGYKLPTTDEWNAKAGTSAATTSAAGLMSKDDKSKLDGIATGATKVEDSSTNGNIKINGTETTVYTHPTGTNPHGTTKSDVGLGNVGNFKAVSTVASQGLTDTEKASARANIGAGTSSFSGSYNDLKDKPTIPQAATTVELNNNGYVTSNLLANQLYASGNHNHNDTYQAKDADLTAIAGLTGTSGLLKKTAANT